MKSLICYFSAQGTTKKVAEKIAKTTESDIFEIKPKQKYTDADLNWMDSQSRSSIEMKNPSFRPEVKEFIKDVSAYDKIAIGFPVWWYTAPTIINTFIENTNLDNKKLYIFVTSGSSGVEGSFNNLKKTYTKLNFISGKRFKGNETESEIKNWFN